MGPNGAYILRETLRACTSHHRLASLLSRHAKSIGFFCSLVSRTRVEEEEGYVYLTRIRRGRRRKRCSMLTRRYSRIPDVFSCLLSCTIFLLAPPPLRPLFLSFLLFLSTILSSFQQIIDYLIVNILD